MVTFMRLLTATRSCNRHSFQVIGRHDAVPSLSQAPEISSRRAHPASGSRVQGQAVRYIESGKHRRNAVQENRNESKNAVLANVGTAVQIHEQRSTPRHDEGHCQRWFMPSPFLPPLSQLWESPQVSDSQQF